MTENHRALLQNYVDDLRRAVEEAQREYENDFQRALERFDGDLARAKEYLDSVLSVPADPLVLGGIRRYWLQCDAVNRELPAGSAVDPETFLLDWLGGVDETLRNIVEQLPYWPVGQDSSGR